MRLSVNKLNFSYGNHPVLINASLCTDSRGLVCVLGKNGAGKSTLFRCMLGLLPIPPGCIDLDGKDLHGMNYTEKARVMAYVPQGHISRFRYCVSDMVLMGTAGSLRSFASPGPAQKKAAADAMKSLGIEHLAAKNFSKISAGEQQLTLLARALAQKASILIMDEPCSSLDYGNCTRVMQEIRRLADSGYLILISTHHPEQAFLYADRAIVLKDGSVIRNGPPDQALDEAVLSELYKIPVSVLEMEDGRRFCLPRREE